MQIGVALVKHLLPTVHKLADEFEGEVTVRKVNVDTNRELAAQFGVRSIPTLSIPT